MDFVELIKKVGKIAKDINKCEYCRIYADVQRDGVHVYDVLYPKKIYDFEEFVALFDNKY